MCLRVSKIQVIIPVVELLVISFVGPPLNRQTDSNLIGCLIIRNATDRRIENTGMRPENLERKTAKPTAEISL